MKIKGPENNPDRFYQLPTRLLKLSFAHPNKFHANTGRNLLVAFSHAQAHQGFRIISNVTIFSHVNTIVGAVWTR